MCEVIVEKLSKRQTELLSNLKNPSKIVATVAEAHRTGHDDLLLIQESNEIRIANIYQGYNITGTLEALQRRNLISFRIVGQGSYRTFFIKLIGA